MDNELKAIEPEDPTVIPLDSTPKDEGTEKKETEPTEDSGEDQEEHAEGMAEALKKFGMGSGEEEPSEKPRDEKGRFAKKEGEKATEETGEKDTELPKKEDEKPETTVDLDEDETRGKELLAEEEKSTKESEAKTKEAEDKKKAEAEKAKAEERGKPKPPPPIVPLTQDDANIFMQLAKGGKVKIGNSELDVDAYIEANPEVALVAGNIAWNLLQQMQHLGMIPTQDGLKQEFKGDLTKEADGLKNTIADMQNAMFVMNIRLHGIPDPEGLSGNEKFKPWYDKQKPEIQALFRSSSASDHAKGWKRFMKEMNLPGVEKKEAADQKARENKMKKDNLFKSNIKRTPAASQKQEDRKGRPTEPDDADYREGLEEGMKKYGFR